MRRVVVTKFTVLVPLLLLGILQICYRRFFGIEVRVDDREGWRQTGTEDVSISTQKSQVHIEDIPPDSDAKKHVLILSYMRVGSTFLGSMFYEMPSAFYYYEPYDALYEHMYGTRPGWAIPTEIHFHKNRSRRSIPSSEVTSVLRLSQQLFDCEYTDDVPDEFFLSPVERWTVSYSKTKYTRCVEKIMLDKEKCWRHIQSVCPQRLDFNSSKTLACIKELSGNSTNEAITQYKACTSDLKRKIQTKCLQNLQQHCSGSDMSVIKSVRLDANATRSLLEADPHLKVIHFFRDPRPVVLSKLKTSWSIHASTPIIHIGEKQKSSETKRHSSRKISSKRKLIVKSYADPALTQVAAREAYLYCDWLQRDLETLKNLPASAADRVLTLTFEEYIHSPAEVLEKLFAFLGVPQPHKVPSIATSEDSRERSLQIARKWMKEFSVNTMSAINNECTQVYKQINTTLWPHIIV